LPHQAKEIDLKKSILVINLKSELLKYTFN
jgi:hypothetical protein